MRIAPANHIYDPRTFKATDYKYQERPTILPVLVKEGRRRAIRRGRRMKKSERGGGGETA